MDQNSLLCAVSKSSVRWPRANKRMISTAKKLTVTLILSWNKIRWLTSRLVSTQEMPSADHKMRKGKSSNNSLSKSKKMKDRPRSVMVTGLMLQIRCMWIRRFMEAPVLNRVKTLTKRKSPSADLSPRQREKLMRLWKTCSRIIQQLGLIRKINKLNWFRPRMERCKLTGLLWQQMPMVT